MVLSQESLGFQKNRPSGGSARYRAWRLRWCSFGPLRISWRRANDASSARSRCYQSGFLLGELQERREPEPPRRQSAQNCRFQLKSKNLEGRKELYFKRQFYRLAMPAINCRVTIPLAKIRAFSRRWKITEFSLFGSVLREDFGPESDVDVLVSFEKGSGWSFFDLVKMEAELEEIFGREVDLVEKDSLRNPFRRHAIMSGREVIYATG